MQEERTKALMAGEGGCAVYTSQERHDMEENFFLSRFFLMKRRKGDKIYPHSPPHQWAPEIPFDAKQQECV